MTVAVVQAGAEIAVEVDQVGTGVMVTAEVAGLTAEVAVTGGVVAGEVVVVTAQKSPLLSRPIELDLS